MKPLDPQLVQRSRTVRTHLVWSVALGGLIALLVIGTSWVIADVVTRRFDGLGVWWLPIIILIAYLIRAGVTWLSGVISERASVRVKHDLRDELVDDLLDPRRVGSRPSSARLTALLGPGTDAFDGYIGRFLPQLALAVVVPAMVIAVVAWTDLLSAAIIVATLPLIGVFMALVGWMTQERVSRRWAQMERLAGHFADVLDGLIVLKIFGRDQERSLRDVGEKHRIESMGALRLAFLSSLVLELVATISVALVAVNIGLRVVDGQMDLRPAMFVLLLAPEAYLPVRRVGAMFHDSAEGATAVGEVLEVLDHEKHTGTLEPSNGPVPIVLNGVVVRHADRGANSLGLDSCRIEPGEFLVVTGPSGAGKSTLLDVLLGFIAPDEGTVLVGDTDLADIDIEAWRRQIAWVPQTPGVLSGTVEENVRLGLADNVSEHELLAALADAGLEDMPRDRQLREGGVDISAGERRRLAIARALLRVRTQGAWLMLLDEPTAGLDVVREADVLAALQELDVTCVIVAHRPETIRVASRSLHIEPGRVEEGVSA